MANLLTFKFSQEFTGINQDQILFLKLNFAEAYDRVEHSFLWAVLRQMQFHEHVITLVKGLVENTQSKVHINGLFTQPFRLGRGVRQGCPLAPLLFALTTQPLMLMFQRKLDNQEQQGLTLADGSAVCHQLFVDDTGLFLKASKQEFQVAHLVIQHYERISGALLNIHKSPKLFPCLALTHRIWSGCSRQVVLLPKQEKLVSIWAAL